MAVNVNLLPELGKEEGKKKKANKYLFLYGGIVLVLTIMIMASSYAMKTIAQSGMKKVQAEQDKLNAVVKQNETTEIKLAEIKQRAKAADNILKQRKSYYIFMNNLEKITPKEIVFTTLAFDTENSVSINGNCPNYDSLLGYMKALAGEWEQLSLTSPEQSKIMFSNVRLTSASRDATTNDIKFTMLFNVEKGAFDAK